MKKTAVSFFAFAFVFLAGASFAQTADVEKTLDELAAKTKAVQSMTADMDIKMTVMNMQMNQTGSMTTKGKLMHGEFTMSMMNIVTQVKMVVDAGGTIWSEADVGGMKMVTKSDAKALKEMMGQTGMDLPGMNAGPTSQSPAEFVEQMRQSANLTLVGEGEIDGTQVYEFSGAMKQEIIDAMKSNPLTAATGLSMDKFKMSVGKDDGLLRRLVYLDPQDAPMMEMTYRNLKINPEIADSEFVYTPPPGVAVMDAVEMMKQFSQGAQPLDLPESVPSASAESFEFNTKLKPGDAAPAFEAPTANGAKQRLADLKGSVVVLNFWSAASEPSLTMLTELKALDKDFHERGLKIVGVNLDDDAASLKKYQSENPGADWPQVFEGKGFDGTVAQLYGVEAIPYTLLIDRTGRIRARDARGPALRKTVEELLSEKSE